MQDELNVLQREADDNETLVVSTDRRPGEVGEWVEPSLYGTVVVSYEHGCQVWLCPVNGQSWTARSSGSLVI